MFRIQTSILAVKNALSWCVNSLMTWWILSQCTNTFQTEDSWDVTFAFTFVLTNIGLFVNLFKVVRLVRKAFLFLLSKCLQAPSREPKVLQQVLVEEEEEEAKQEDEEEAKQMNLKQIQSTDEQVHQSIVQQMDVFNDLETNAHGLCLQPKELHKICTGESFVSKPRHASSSSVGKLKHELQDKQKYLRALKTSEQNQKLANWAFQTAFYLLFAYMCLSQIGFTNTSLWTTLGLGSVFLAFSVQEAVKNVIASIILIFEQTFKPGDFICLFPPSGLSNFTELPSTYLAHSMQRYSIVKGVVAKIGFRTTEILTSQALRSEGKGFRMRIPNSLLVNSIIGVRDMDEPNSELPCFRELFSKPFPIEQYPLVQKAHLPRWKSVLQQTPCCLPELTRLECVQKQNSHDCVLIGTFAFPSHRAEELWHADSMQVFAEICRELNALVHMNQ